MNSYFSDVKKISQEIIDYERGYEDNNIIKWYLYSILTYSYENEDISLHNINLEHVMPIKYKEWETKDKFWKNKEHSIEDYIYKLGNCTLLHEKLNKSISNKIFSEKCEKLFNKELLNKKSSWLSKDESTFGDYTVKRIWKENKNWDKDVIEKRDQMIKDKIIETNLFKFDI